MSDARANMLVLRDPEGQLYLLPRADLEQHRVSDADRTTVEAAITSDTAGFNAAAASTGDWSIFSVMMAYQAMVNREARDDRALSNSSSNSSAVPYRRLS